MKKETVSRPKRYTIKEIAQACGVSTATVSYVLNDVKNQSISEATRNRVLHYAHLVGYVSSGSARALATGRTNTVGFYVPHGENSLGKQRLCQALTRELESRGLRAVMLTDRCLAARVTDVDAVFAIDISDGEFRRLGNNCFVPLLNLDASIDDILYYNFCFDAPELIRRATEQTGCAHAALICGTPHSRGYADYLRRAFGEILPPETALTGPFRDNTVYLTTEPLVHAALAAGKVPCLRMGWEEFPLPFERYASQTVQTALAAIERINPPENHNIRIL